MERDSGSFTRAIFWIWSIVTNVSLALAGSCATEVLPFRFFGIDWAVTQYISASAGGEGHHRFLMSAPVNGNVLMTHLSIMPNTQQISTAARTCVCSDDQRDIAARSGDLVHPYSNDAIKLRGGIGGIFASRGSLRSARM